MFKITNTLSRKKELFASLYPYTVKLYVCGITPYDYAHVGHARVYITFDILYRLLRYQGYAVLYCRNFTDVDDKLIERALKEYQNPYAYTTVAERFIQAFHADMAALNCIPPTYEPRVTETIPEIITYIEELIAGDKAYVINNDVYYHIKSFPEYGKLSKQKLEDLQAGARVGINEEKKDPLDFVLWKGEEKGAFWESPWGWGRPGWHIECSAMAQKFLGNAIDIHGGGMDLIFPHHENEIAQTEGVTHQTFAQYWMHIAFVRVNQEKMSKSLGNFFTLQDLFKKYDPAVIRFFIATHHYNVPLDFSEKDLEVAQKTYYRLCIFFEPLSAAALVDESMVRSSVVENMLHFLCDDLNTPGMFGVVFENFKYLTLHPEEAIAVKTFLQTIVGLELIPLRQEVTITPEIQQLLEARENARLAKDWALADQLRDQLKALGYVPQDGKSN